MKYSVRTGVWLIGGLLLSSAALTQAPPPVPQGPPPTPPSPQSEPPKPLAVPVGTPEGLDKMVNHNSTGQPAPQLVEGQPIETRPPELVSDHPIVPGSTRAPYHATPGFQVTTITDQLKAPWSVAILPDGKFLVTEKLDATMRIVEAKGSVSPPLSGLPPIAARQQVGLLDLALDPKFAANHHIFFTYNQSLHQFGSPVEDSRLVIARATLNEAANSLSEVKEIFHVTPSFPLALQANQGGRIVFDRGGVLSTTVGDRSGSPPWDYAQRLDMDAGKIIHITPDGAPVKGNPFIGKTGALPEIWSYGHRSEEGLTIDPATGQLWEVEDGPRGGDKLLHILPGKNYGWPIYNHGLDYPGEVINTGSVEAAGTEQPVYYWDPVIAPSGLAFYHGKLFPAWQHSLFVGGLRGSMLDRLEIANGKVVAEEPLMWDQKYRFRDVRIGPDGAVYVLVDQGKLFKLTPK